MSKISKNKCDFIFSLLKLYQKELKYFSRCSRSFGEEWLSEHSLRTNCDDHKSGFIWREQFWPRISERLQTGFWTFQRRPIFTDYLGAYTRPEDDQDESRAAQCHLRDEIYAHYWNMLPSLALLEAVNASTFVGMSCKDGSVHVQFGPHEILQLLPLHLAYTPREGLKLTRTICTGGRQ